MKRAIDLVHRAARAAPNTTALAGEFQAVRREFPCVGVRAAGPIAADVEVARDAWFDHRFDPQDFDRALAGAQLRRGQFRIRLVGADDPLALEVLTRAQRYVDRRNAASAGVLFDRILALHAGLHDFGKVLVRADYAHALDVWQWTLRLAPSADLALQTAALFHDVERLVSESERRIEQHAVDYVEFKRAHARRGAALTRRALEALALPEQVLAEVGDLVSTHETPRTDSAARILNDADALSFFSLNSAGFVDHYGIAHARAKVAYTIGRLQPAQRWRLGAMRLRADVRDLVDTQLENAGPGGAGGAG